MMYILLSVLCSLFVVWRLWFKKSSLEPPELSGWRPIIGHAYKLMGDVVQMLKSLKKMGEECTEKGGIVTIYLGFRKIYAITDPEDCVTVMNTCLQKHFFFSFAKAFLGDGLITADVPTWKKNRKLLNPAFNQQVLDGFIDIFNIQAERLVDQFSKDVGKPFDQEILLRVNNLETICSTSLGVYGSDSEFSKFFSEYLSRLSSIIHAINERLQKFWLHSDFIYNFSPEKKRIDEDARHLSALSQLIIRKKKLEREQQEKNLSSIETKFGKTSGKFKPFIDLILDLAAETGCFTDEQIKFETEATIAGGHDTSATVLTFTLATLGTYTDVQEKAYQEICHVLGNSNKAVNKEDLNNLVYIEAILKEILRLHVIIPALPRNVDKDVKLKNYTIKANSECFIFLHGLHHHSIWGPDAAQFRPERWLDKDTLPDPKYLGAFGLGRRACIGKSYAMMTMKIILAHVVRKFHIASDITNMVSKMNVLIRPQSGHNITLTPRNA